MWWGFAMLLVHGCNQARPPASSTPVSATADSATLDTAPTKPTGLTPSGDTGHTGATAPTGDTGTDTLPLFRKPGEPLEPYATISTTAWSKGSSAIPMEDGPDVLLFSHEVPDADGNLEIVGVPLPELPPPGDHDIADLWDGTSITVNAPLNGQQYVHIQEDATGDGIPDFWLGSRMFAGPIEGFVFTDEVFYLDYTKTLAASDPNDPYDWPLDGDVLAAGFDADGDGHDDILVGSGGVMSQAFIHYGPFDDIVPSARLGHATDYSSLGEGSDGCTRGVHFVHNMLGPGEPGVIFGSVDPSLCAIDRSFFPIGLDRDTHLPEPPGWLDSGWSSVLPAGDIDGDGISDYAISWNSGKQGSVLKGPPSGGDLANLPTIDVHHGVVNNPLGDINGDGLDDFGGWWYASGSDVVLLSPHPPGPVNMSRGVQVNGFPFSGDYNKVTTGDFDGDGLGDIVYGGQIYTGAQLTAAWNELHGLPTDTGSTSTATPTATGDTAAP